MRKSTAPTAIRGATAAARYIARHPQLAGIDPALIRAAWFTMAHLLLHPSASVVDMGCGDGAQTFVMAVLNPELNFVGVDADPEKITQAQTKWDLPNLRFAVSDLRLADELPLNSFDAVINSLILHDIHSDARKNSQSISDTLKRQFALLKNEGWLYIRDYALRRPADDFVLLEMPDNVNGAEDVADMAEVDLLRWYSHHARPLEDSAIHGFFLEELPPRLPKTRLFRLPYKWAYEFILRKDDRAALGSNINKEFAIFTEQEFNKQLRALGGRVLYNAPLWDEKTVKDRFEGRFRIFDDEGREQGPPPTSFIALAQKLGSRQSLSVQERRPSANAPKKLRVTSMVNEQNGRIIDIVSRDFDATEIIPFRVTAEGQLHIFVHEGLPRGIVNSVPRNGKNLDGRVWSGHMVEAISVPSDIVHSLDQAAETEDFDIFKFSLDYLGLKPIAGAKLEEGPSFYPAPDLIDELVKTRYLQVRTQAGVITPKQLQDDVQGFATTGGIREINAQKIIDAISIGLIPNSRLELQIISLFEKLNLEAEEWDGCPLVLEESKTTHKFDLRGHIKLKMQPDERLKPSKKSAGTIRGVQSTFVDDGLVEGNITGIAARDMEFIVSDENTVNRAVIMPLTKEAGQVMVGLELDHLPSPQRVEGNGAMARLPVIDLPKEITTIHQARQYIADTCKVRLQDVWRLGESYFCHAGVTPQRIFPFAVAVKGQFELPRTGPVQFGPLKFIFQVYNFFLWKSDLITMTCITRARRRMGADYDMGIKLAAGFEAANKPVGPAIMNVSSLTGLGAPKKDYV